MAVLHLMVGLPCSGKTTRARQLEKQTNALLLTTDVWHLRLYGSDVDTPEHDVRHAAIEKIMWDVAKRVLALGCDAGPARNAMIFAGVRSRSARSFRYTIWKLRGKN